MRRPYRYHVFSCAGGKCGPEHGEDLAKRFKNLLPDRRELGIRVSVSRCLGMCAQGPNVVVYPEGVVYHGVDEGDVERIVDEHLRHGRPIEELMRDRNRSD